MNDRFLRGLDFKDNGILVNVDAQSLYTGSVVTMQFATAFFTDNLTSSNYLRQTIEIVPTNSPDGLRLALVGANDMPNVPSNETHEFTASNEWALQTLCFRFITTDLAGNVATSAYPLAHHFTVVPEPATLAVVAIALTTTILRRRG